VGCAIDVISCRRNRNKERIGGSVAVNVNDNVGYYFQTKKRLRQGDPLSSILFNIIMDLLKVLIGRAKLDEQFEGLIPHLVDGGLSILQYTDDTILFMDHDIDKSVQFEAVAICI
jgi:hypothetical protein